MKRRSPAPHGKAEARLPEEAGKRFTAKVEAVGVQGHGVAQFDGTKVFIPYTLPGETVLAVAFGTGARLVEIEHASPERIEPVCKHFGTCGGCTLQHWSEARYRDWKVDLITSALSRVGIKAVPEKLRSYPVSSRRRATLAARKAGGVIEMGFHSERTHTITDLEECPVLVPQIAASLP
ncbi:MAG: TRAM domain-containing protein [Rhodomicrobium sp.]